MMIAQVTTKGQLVIPYRLRSKYFIGTGTKVVFDEENGKITIQPVTEAFVNSLCGILKSKDGSATEALLKERKEELAKGK
ncbi:MAG: AbrB/MazE/SpoVT family DNA-binding domain-containing protein [Victivallales bacterium]